MSVVHSLARPQSPCCSCLLGLFKMLQEGSPCVLLECYQHLAWLQNVRKTAKYVAPPQPNVWDSQVVVLVD